MKRVKDFSDVDYGAMLKENDIFVNHGEGRYMNAPRSVPNHGYLNHQKKSVFGNYMVYTGNDMLFDVWVLVRGTHIDIVDGAQFVESFDAGEKLLESQTSDMDILRPKYQIYLSRLTDSESTDRFYMGVRLYRSGKIYKNSQIIFGLGINPRKEELNFDKYGFLPSERREVEDWFSS